MRSIGTSSVDSRQHKVVGMNNLELWNKVKEVPETAQRPILGGRLKGMTEISPMWRIFKMTEIFGPAGTGWNYSIDKLWTEPGSDG